MAGQCGAAPAGQEGKPVIDALHDLVHAERSCPGGGELNGQRHSVEASANADNGLEILRLRREAGAEGLGPGNEKLHRAVLEDMAGILRMFRRHIKRANVIDILTIDPQKLTTGCNYGDVRTIMDDCFSDLRRGIYDMLTVIEHEQQASIGDCVGDGCRRRPVAMQRETQGTGNRRCDQSGIR